jgi:ABC-type arginine/histidine transport system permease subunit
MKKIIEVFINIKNFISLTIILIYVSILIGFLIGLSLDILGDKKNEKIPTKEIIRNGTIDRASN